MKKYDNIKSLSITELQEQINDSEKTLQRLKFSHRLTPLENPMQIRGLRKQIARLYTLLAAKQS
ncbi:MAG: 50S ribosomal protein L29 [Cytophagales bacterium]|nr:MAG: 50S ribosomal protein L29 [Cytophagales bacterium]